MQCGVRDGRGEREDLPEERPSAWTYTHHPSVPTVKLSVHKNLAVYFLETEHFLVILTE